WRDTKTDCSEAFNKFIGESNELLKTISFFTAVDNVDYTIKIYDDFDGTELQNELSIKSGAIDYIGLHTIDLDTVVTLSDGEDFYVYLSLSDGGHPYDRTSDVPVLLGAQYRTIVTSSASPEESYYKSGNDWLDFYYYDDPSGYQNTGNFCIKGLAGITGLKVTPNEDFQPEGSIGGPFTPQSKIYELENKGITLFSYEVTNIPTVDWITLSGNTSGALGPGETTEITVEINENANSLGNGAYMSTIQFINTTDHIGDTTRDVVLIIGEATLWNEWTFDTDPGWTIEEDWAFGQPTGNGGEHGEPDPTSGYTGNNVYGYNLNGDYPNNLPETHLTSTAIDCSNLYDVHLKFWRWLGVEQPQYDHAYVRVSNDGSNWTTIWENPEEITDDTWTQVDLDISDVADNQETVYLRWTMGETDSGWMYCGWNIDDVQIFAVEGFITHIDNIIENTTKLFGSYPNPFNPETTISYQLTADSKVSLSIYNVKGQKVNTLVNEILPAGEHSVIWNGKDSNGNQVSSGIYFYKLKAGDYQKVKKMLLLK
ncbi:MAG: T9SS type A sorting domain-containing protein, partial [Candidatus Cloacimonetes bacterium]|nr:T9SS type A sorting domain-containing protein [Candidatus Cloacimonadota bacterium]